MKLYFKNFSLGLKKEFFFFFFVILSVCFGAMNEFLTYFVFCFLALLFMVFAKEFVHNSSLTLCKGLLLLISLQNLSIGIGSNLTGNDDKSLSLLTQIPFLFILIQWGMFVYCNKAQFVKNKINFVFLFLLLFSILFSTINGIFSLSSTLLSTRNLLAFIMIFDIGYRSIVTSNDLRELTIFVIKLSFIIFILGIVLLIEGFPLYDTIGIKNVYIAKGSPILGDALDDRFTTALYMEDYNRMGSIFYEPVSLGYFYASAFLIVFFTEWSTCRIKKVIAIFTVGLGLIFTFGKGGYLIVIFSSLFYFLEKSRAIMIPFVNKKLIRLFIIFILLLFISFFSIYYYLNIKGAVIPHFVGIIETFKSIIDNPFGHGIGNGGNSLLIFGDSSSYNWLSSGGETQLMSFFYQIGIHGGLFFIVCVLLTMAPIGINSKKGGAIFIVVPIALLVLSLMQDNTFTVQCITLFMLFQGGINKLYKNSCRNFEVI